MSLVRPAVPDDELLLKVIDSLRGPCDLEPGLATWPPRDLVWNKHGPSRCPVTPAPLSSFPVPGPAVGAAVFKTEDIAAGVTLLLPLSSAKLVQVRCPFRSALPAFQVQVLQVLLDNGHGQVLGEKV